MRVSLRVNRHTPNSDLRLHCLLQSHSELLNLISFMSPNLSFRTLLSSVYPPMCSYCVWEIRVRLGIKNQFQVGSDSKFMRTVDLIRHVRFDSAWQFLRCAYFSHAPGWTTMSILQSLKFQLICQDVVHVPNSTSTRHVIRQTLMFTSQTKADRSKCFKVWRSYNTAKCNQCSKYKHLNMTRHLILNCMFGRNALCSMCCGHSPITLMLTVATSQARVQNTEELTCAFYVEGKLTMFTNCSNIFLRYEFREQAASEWIQLKWYPTLDTRVITSFRAFH